MNDIVLTILFLGVVALSEGVRRLSPGAFVLRRDVFGAWKLAPTLELGREMHVVAWGMPISMPVVLTDKHDDGALTLRRLLTRLRARSRRVAVEIRILRIVGTLVLVGLVVGIPWATLRWDAWGLMLGIELVVFLCIAQAIVTFMALRRAGAPRRPAARLSLKALWPFTAPRAAELVQDQVVAGVPSLAVAHELLGETPFLTAMRPMVYDALSAFEHNRATTVLTSLCGRERLVAFLREPPSTGEDPFCPRCASRYRPGVKDCSNCAGVALAAVP